MILDVFRVTISKTADGTGDYLQAISSDQVGINVVLVAARIELTDARPPKTRGT